MYLSFGDMQPTHFTRLTFCFLRLVFSTNIRGRSEKSEIPAATNIIAEKLQLSFQKSRRTKREPIIAPDVSMA